MYKGLGVRFSDFVLCWALFWYALLCLFLFCNHHDGEKRYCCFAFIAFWMSCYCKSPAALPHGAVGWFAVCHRGIS